MKTLNEVMTEHKTLNTTGFGVTGKMDPLDRSQKLYEYRIELRRKEDQVLLVAAWMTEALKKNTSVSQNSGWSSYGLKHIAEKALGGSSVNNGVLIAAALMADFPVLQHRQGTNAQIGVYKPSTRKLWESLGSPV